MNATEPEPLLKTAKPQQQAVTCHSLHTTALTHALACKARHMRLYEFSTLYNPL